jgi:hypothetical protein
MMATQTKPKPKLDEATLYLGDNGRCFCGRLRCAGMTAYTSGRDLSGRKVQSVRPEVAAQYGLRCETCPPAAAVGGH